MSGDRGLRSRIEVRLYRQMDHMHFVQFEYGKAVEHWGVSDDLSMMCQLGLIPSPEEASSEHAEEASPT